MALGDKQVLNSQVAAGNSDYLIPGAVSLQLKAVQALFTDNGAGGDWLPAVVAISDSGHVFWRAVDQGVKVTAGSDAEVSWFPGVKHAPAAAAAAALPIFGILSLSAAAFGDAPYSVPAGGTSNIQFPHQYASDSGAFSFAPSTTYSDTITLSSLDYIYVIHASWKWGTIGITTQVVIDGPQPQLDGSFLWGALDFHGETFANTFVTGGPFPGDNLFGVDTKTYVCDTVPQSITLPALHNSVTAKDIIEANLLVVAYKVF